MTGTPLVPPVDPRSPSSFESDRAPVLLAFAGPARQHRLTVLFRLVLAIPQLVVLSILGIAVEIILVIAWFGALFMGRLPGFAADFLPGYLRWQVRVSAYLTLLTGQYPPFTFDDVDYPVRLAVRPGQLNRLAVLLRIFIVLPAAIAGNAAAAGLYTIGLFVAWLIVLFTGTMPTALHNAIAAIVRYQARISGYLFLVTAEYPWGLFGDRDTAHEAYATAPPGAGYGEGAPAGYGEGPSAGYGSGPAAPGYAAPPPVPAEGAGYGAPAPAGQNRWRLILTKGQARLVGLFIAIGVAVWAGYIVAFSVLASSPGGVVQRVNAISQSQLAYAKLSAATRTFASTASSCQSSAQGLSCATRADGQLAQDFGSYARTMRGVSMPSGPAAGEAARLAAVATQAQQVFQRLARSTSASQYQQTVRSSNITQVLGQVDLDYQDLVRTLTR